MDAKQQALEQIRTIAAEHGLTAEDIAAAVPTSANEAEGGAQSSILTSLFAYLGGIFVLAGLGVFIEMQWDSMNFLARVVITLGTGMAAFVMAYLVSGDARWTQVATPLFLLAGVLQPWGIFVIFDEFSRGGNERHAILLTTGLMLAQHLAVFWTLRRTVLLFLALVFGVWFYGNGMDLAGVDEDWIFFTMGLSVLLVTRAIGRSPHAVITPFWYFVSATSMLTGLFALTQDTVIEILFLGAACGLVFLSTWVKSRSLLFVGTVAILGYVGYYTAEHFSDVVGWPIALILFGLLLLGVSLFAFRINRKYIANA